MHPGMISCSGQAMQVLHVEELPAAGYNRGELGEVMLPRSKGAVVDCIGNSLAHWPLA